MFRQEAFHRDRQFGHRRDKLSSAEAWKVKRKTTTKMESSSFIIAAISLFIGLSAQPEECLSLQMMAVCFQDTTNGGRFIRAEKLKEAMQKPRIRDRLNWIQRW